MNAQPLAKPPTSFRCAPLPIVGGRPKISAAYRMDDLRQAPAPVPHAPAADPLAAHRITHPKLSLSDFHQLTHEERNAFIKKGGQLID